MNETLESKFKKEQLELNKMMKILKKYPDLKENRDSWNRIRYSTPAINSETDDVDISYSCGCCDDAPLLARPFKSIEGIKVYSDPISFTIGEQISCYCGEGDRPYNNWQDKMRKKNITEAVISKIQKYFDENKPKRYELVDDDYEN